MSPLVREGKDGAIEDIITGSRHPAGDTVHYVLAAPSHTVLLPSLFLSLSGLKESFTRKCKY